MGVFLENKKISYLLREIRLSKFCSFLNKLLQLASDINHSRVKQQTATDCYRLLKVGVMLVDHANICPAARVHYPLKILIL